MLVGSGPYSASDVTGQLGCRVIGTVADDPRGARALAEGGSFRALARSALVRSVRTLAASLPLLNSPSRHRIGARRGTAMTVLDRPPRWFADPAAGRVPLRLVGRVHASVGEALTQRHAADEEARRPRLSPEDERALSHKLICDELERLAGEAISEGRRPLSDEDEEELTAAVLDRLHGLGRLQPLLDDPEIRDIHISGAARIWLQMRDGSKVRGPAIAETDEEVVELIATAARRVGRSERRWDHAHPELNLQLPNGDRLHALMAVTGRPTVTIRRHDFAIHRVHQLVDLGVVDVAMGAFLSAAVRARTNMIVAGGTGTGKTTTLRCLINEIPPTSASSPSRTRSRSASSTSSTCTPITRRSRPGRPTPRASASSPSPTGCGRRCAWTPTG